MSAATTPRNFTDGVITGTDDGGNSETVPLLVSLSWDGLVPDGRELEVYQAQGAVTGARKGARAYPTVTIEIQAASLDDPFFRLINGIIAGFTSTTADIGDYAAIDLSIDESYSTDTRISTWQDCIVTGEPYTGGSPGSVSITFQVLGPVTIDGDTWVSSR
jgi:hypothetical protein